MIRFDERGSTLIEGSEPSQPFSHAAKTQDEPYGRLFDPDPPWPQMEVMKVIHKSIKGPVAMPTLLPRDK